MKTILTIGLMLLLSIQANAQAVPFDYTGNYAFNFGYLKDFPMYYPSGGPGPLGGPSDDWGSASQFTISQPTMISDLVVNAHVVGSEGPAENFLTTSYVYQIFTGSRNFRDTPFPVPDLSTLIYTSGPVTFTDPGNMDQADYSGLDVPFNVNLQPGTYWLGELGNGADIVVPTQEYIDPVTVTPNQTAAVPEPHTGWLLLFGLLVAAACRKAVRIIPENQ